jgi:hypothetical protein
MPTDAFLRHCESCPSIFDLALSASGSELAGDPLACRHSGGTSCKGCLGLIAAIAASDRAASGLASRRDTEIANTSQLATDLAVRRSTEISASDRLAAELASARIAEIAVSDHAAADLAAQRLREMSDMISLTWLPS